MNDEDDEDYAFVPEYDELLCDGSLQGRFKDLTTNRAQSLIRRHALTVIERAAAGERPYPHCIVGCSCRTGECRAKKAAQTQSVLRRTAVPALEHCPSSEDGFFVRKRPLHVAVLDREGRRLDEPALGYDVSKAAIGRPPVRTLPEGAKALGLIAAPFESVTLAPETSRVIEMTSSFAMRAPYYLSVVTAGGPVAVKSLMLGNQIVFGAPGGLDSRQLACDESLGHPEGLIPIAGSVLLPYHRVQLVLASPWCAATVRATAVLWGTPLEPASSPSPVRASLDLFRPERLIIPTDLAFDVEPDWSAIKGCAATPVPLPEPLPPARGLLDFARIEHSEAQRRDRAATQAFLDEQRRPVDEADDAAWESPTDEWP